MTTTFIDLRSFPEKADVLRGAVNGSLKRFVYEVDVSELRGIPGSPIAYSISEGVAKIFQKFPAWAKSGRSAHQGLATADNFRFVRGWWEVPPSSHRWKPLSKGSNRVPFYCELSLVMNWLHDGAEMKSWAGTLYNNSHWSRIMMNYPLYFQPGITYSRRPHLRGWFQMLPEGAIFSTDSPIIVGRPLSSLKADAAVLNSSIYSELLGLLMARGTSGGQTLKYETGYVSSVPIPEMDTETEERLQALVDRGFEIACAVESVSECSRYFRLPTEILGRISRLPRPMELEKILEEVNRIAVSLYDLTSEDLASLRAGNSALASTLGDGTGANEDDEEDEDREAIASSVDDVLSWTIGVAFGRFDIRLATGERAAPPEPEPFDPLPAKSPGMLPDGDAPFHSHAGILVDDSGHAHDLVRIAERVLERVDVPVPAELRRLLQKDFFSFHLQRYSKSRRKAPIYWPLATTSGSYTLWLYYPSLTSQTLYTAINDFVEPKLAEVEAEAATLRAKGSVRSRDEEKRLEALATLEAELRDLRDQLLAISPHYKPNHDDGVQITAAPLWPLFRHKPWQKVLKDTWAKLEKGEYDWAHLAMNYWPERVREKCKHDKSLAIAHGLEELYVEPPAAPKKARGRKTAGAEE